MLSPHGAPEQVHVQRGFAALLLLWVVVHAAVAYYSPPFTDQLQIIDYGRAWLLGLELGTVQDQEQGPPNLSAFWLGPLLAYLVFALTDQLWLQSTVLALGLPVAALALRGFLHALGVGWREASLLAALLLLEPNLNYAAWCGRLEAWAWAVAIAAAWLLWWSSRGAIASAWFAGGLVAVLPWIWPRAILWWPALGLWALWCVGSATLLAGERRRLVLRWLAAAMLLSAVVLLGSTWHMDAWPVTFESVAVERAWHTPLLAQLYQWAAVAKLSLPLYLLGGLALLRPSSWPLALAFAPTLLWAWSGTTAGLVHYVGPLAVLLVARSLAQPQAWPRWCTLAVVLVLAWQAAIVLLLRPAHVSLHAADRDPERRDALYAATTASAPRRMVDFSLDFYQPGHQAGVLYSAPHYYALVAHERLPTYLRRVAPEVVVVPLVPERYFRITADPEQLEAALRTSGYCPGAQLGAGGPSSAPSYPIRFELHQLGGNRGYGPYQVWQRC